MPLSPSAPGVVLNGAYELLEHIASGGMGAIHRARRLSDGALVAVKTLHQRLHGNHEAIQRFEREAEAIRRLRHPDIISLLDHGVDHQSGTMYLVIEWLEGEDLQEVIERQGPLSARDAAWIAYRVTRCLAYAHARKIIHRDLKPENIFLAEDPQTGELQVKILDFGLAKILDDDQLARITCMGEVCGTPAFMSPEQARGEQLDGRCDLYALGCVLFNMLTGAAPFEGDNPLKIMSKHQLEPLPALPPGTPMMLERILARATTKGRSHRYPTAALMGSALRAFIRNVDQEAARAHAASFDAGDTGPNPARVATKTDPNPLRAAGGLDTQPPELGVDISIPPSVQAALPTGWLPPTHPDDRAQALDLDPGLDLDLDPGLDEQLVNADELRRTTPYTPAAKAAPPAPLEPTVFEGMDWNPGAPPVVRETREGFSFTGMLGVAFLVLAAALSVIHIM